jgi:hypothetical protein
LLVVLPFPEISIIPRFCLCLYKRKHPTASNRIPTNDPIVAPTITGNVLFDGSEVEVEVEVEGDETSKFVVHRYSSLLLISSNKIASLPSITLELTLFNPIKKNNYY